MKKVGKQNSALMALLLRDQPPPLSKRMPPPFCKTSRCHDTELGKSQTSSDSPEVMVHHQWLSVYWSQQF